MPLRVFRLVGLASHQAVIFRNSCRTSTAGYSFSHWSTSACVIFALLLSFKTISATVGLVGSGVGISSGSELTSFNSLSLSLTQSFTLSLSLTYTLSYTACFACSSLAKVAFACFAVAPRLPACFLFSTTSLYLLLSSSKRCLIKKPYLLMLLAFFLFLHIQI